MDLNTVVPNNSTKFSINYDNINNQLWLGISEAANICGVNNKTIRRAIQAHKISYRIVKGRYQVELGSAIEYMHTNTKLHNKLLNNGIGQYIIKWENK